VATQLDEGVPTPLKVTRPRKAAAAPGTATKAARTRKAVTGPVAATKVSRPRKAMTGKAVTPEAKAAPKPAARKPAMVSVAELIEAPAPVAERMAPEPAQPVPAAYMADEVPVPVTAPPRRFRFSRLFSWLGPVRKTRSSAAG
jgi:hypothetical protein